MNLVKEHIIFEKFQEESDPVKDLGIGKSKLIKDWLEQYRIEHYKLNDDLSINTNFSINLSQLGIRNLPDYIQFNTVDGDFSIQTNYFTNLKGCPEIVMGAFSCSSNQLRSLEFSPKYARDFFCHHNIKKFTKKEVLKYCKVARTIVV